MLGGFKDVTKAYDCALCQDPALSDLRELWGCDEPTEEEQFSIECFLCGGSNHKCPRCKGTGSESVYRCPRSIVKQDMVDIVRVCILVKRERIWPALGGSNDQSRNFLAAYEVFIEEASRIELEGMKKK